MPRQVQLDSVGVSTFWMYDHPSPLPKFKRRESKSYSAVLAMLLTMLHHNSEDHALNTFLCSKQYFQHVSFGIVLSLFHPENSEHTGIFLSMLCFKEEPAVGCNVKVFDPLAQCTGLLEFAASIGKFAVGNQGDYKNLCSFVSSQSSFAFPQQ